MFVTIEGPNGAGKTTIIDGIIALLSNEGLETVRTKEPTNSELGKFFKKAEELYSGNCLACLAAADRYFHLESEIIPAVKSGKIVISDRYIESSLVLQRLDGCDIDFIWGLNSLVLVPDLSVTLISSPEIVNKRLVNRKKKLSRFERTKTRSSEISFYEESAKFLVKKKFNILLLKNDDGNIEKNIKKIVSEIKTLAKKGKSK